VTIKAARNIATAGLAFGLLMTASSFTASAQDSDAAETYAKLLQQISDVKMATAQKELYLAKQDEQIASADELKASVKPLVIEMVAEAEKEMNKDVPFNIVERFARLDKLKEDLASPNASISSLFRQVMNIYDTEVVAGSAVASYNGNHPLNPGVRLKACDESLESPKCDLTDDFRGKLPLGATSIEAQSLRDELYDGYYVHFGRMALIYLQFDSSEGWRWDTEAKEWVEMGAGDVLDARRAVRIARGESAPGVVLAPIRVSDAN